MRYEDCLSLSGESWTSLTEEEKVELLQSIENHIAAESGRTPCEVIPKCLYTGVDGITLGQYSRNNDKIYINSTQLDSESRYGKTSEELVKAVLHEGRHAYQHCVAEGEIEFCDEEIAQEWKTNFKEGNYISYTQNPRAYYNQPVEVDARAFADIQYEKFVDEREELSNSQMIDVSDEKSASEIFAEQLEAQEAQNYSSYQIGEELEGMNEGIGM